MVLLKISYAFQQCKNFENRLLRFDKVTESLKVGSFLRHSVVLCCPCQLTDCVTLIQYDVMIGNKCKYYSYYLCQ